MTCLARNFRMLACGFKFIYVFVTALTNFFAGMIFRELFYILYGICAIVAVFSKRFGNKKMAG